MDGSSGIGTKKGLLKKKTLPFVTVLVIIHATEYCWCRKKGPLAGSTTGGFGGREVMKLIATTTHL